MLIVNIYNYKFNDSSEVCLNKELEFYLFVFRAEVIWEISIKSSCFLRISRRKEWSFVWTQFFGSGIPFQILAPTLQKLSTCTSKPLINGPFVLYLKGFWTIKNKFFNCRYSQRYFIVAWDVMNKFLVSLKREMIFLSRLSVDM